MLKFLKKVPAELKICADTFWIGAPPAAFVTVPLMRPPDESAKLMFVVAPAVTATNVPPLVTAVHSIAHVTPLYNV